MRINYLPYVMTHDDRENTVYLTVNCTIYRYNNLGVFFIKIKPIYINELYYIK